MNVSIVYFSGTGNTKAIAEGYQSVLIKAGHVVECFSIEENKTLSDHELLIVGGPIYAGNMPDELIAWVRRNVNATNVEKQAIVFSTSAVLLNAYGPRSIGKKLMKKGYSILDLSPYEMPRNFYIEKYEPTPEDVQQQQFEKAAKQIVESVLKIEQRQPMTVEGSVLLIDLMADIFRIMAKSMGKSFEITDSCIECGLCEQSCPKKNIQVKERKFSNKCILCTRCIHHCPVNAIRYKGKQIEPYLVHHELNL